MGEFFGSQISVRSSCAHANHLLFQASRSFKSLACSSEPFTRSSELFARSFKLFVHSLHPFQTALLSVRPFMQAVWPFTLAVRTAYQPVSYPFDSHMFHPLHEYPLVYIFQWKVTNVFIIVHGDQTSSATIAQTAITDMENNPYWIDC